MRQDQWPVYVYYVNGQYFQSLNDAAEYGQEIIALTGSIDIRRIPFNVSKDIYKWCPECYELECKQHEKSFTQCIPCFRQVLHDKLRGKNEAQTNTTNT